MVSQITQCIYNSGSPFSAHQLSHLQQGGMHDISRLVGKFVQQYFQYTGSEIYNLDITRNRIVFKLINTSTTQTLELRDQHWIISNNGTHTTLDDALKDTVSGEIIETLTKIRTSASPASPSDRLSSTPSIPSAALPLPTPTKPAESSMPTAPSLTPSKSPESHTSEEIEQLRKELERIHKKNEELIREREQTKKECAELYKGIYEAGLKGEKGLEEQRRRSEERRKKIIEE